MEVIKIRPIKQVNDGKKHFVSKFRIRDQFMIDTGKGDFICVRINDFRLNEVEISFRLDEHVTISK